MLTDNAHQQIDLRTHENFEFELRKSDLVRIFKCNDIENYSINERENLLS